MRQYLLKCKQYYFIWYEPEPGKPQLNGPHMEPMINLPVIEVDNPLAFKPPDNPTEKGGDDGK